ncbi:hypothetical protein HpBGD46_15220 [Helicobacter pylori]
MGFLKFLIAKNGHDDLSLKKKTEPTRQAETSYAVSSLKKKKKNSYTQVSK